MLFALRVKQNVVQKVKSAVLDVHLNFPSPLYKYRDWTNCFSFLLSVFLECCHFVENNSKLQNKFSSILTDGFIQRVSKMKAEWDESIWLWKTKPGHRSQEETQRSLEAITYKPPTVPSLSYPLWTHSHLKETSCFLVWPQAAGGSLELIFI